MKQAVKPYYSAIRQSPLNEKQWNVELVCGHELWVTRSKRPTAKKFDCYRCDEVSRETVNNG